MFQMKQRICKLFATFINILLILSGSSIVDANRQTINSMNLTSTNTAKVKVLNFGFDQSGTLNMSFQALQPWDQIKVRSCYINFSSLKLYSVPVEQHGDHIQRS